MEKIPHEALEFLNNQRTCVVAVKMPDGVPHCSTLHFAYIEDEHKFIFLTAPSYRKVEPLKMGETLASVVVGTNEDIMKTLQLDGSAKLEDSEKSREIYFKKFPEKINKYPDNIFFTFTSNWWRFTDWETPEGKKIWLSE